MSHTSEILHIDQWYEPYGRLAAIDRTDADRVYWFIDAQDKVFLLGGDLIDTNEISLRRRDEQIS